MVEVGPAGAGARLVTGGSILEGSLRHFRRAAAERSPHQSRLVVRRLKAIGRLLDELVADTGQFAGEQLVEDDTQGVTDQ